MQQLLEINELGYNIEVPEEISTLTKKNNELQITLLTVVIISIIGFVSVYIKYRGLNLNKSNNVQQPAE
jgi:hypothetical protein